MQTHPHAHRASHHGTDRPSAVHRDSQTNPHAHLCVDTDAQGPEGHGPVLLHHSGAPSCYHLPLVSLWKEAGDVVGIWCQFHRHPALGLQPHWGPAAACLLRRGCGGAWERAPWPQSALVWDSEPRGSRSESLLPLEQAQRPRGTRLLRFPQPPICPNQPVPTNPKIESLAET